MHAVTTRLPNQPTPSTTDQPTLKNLQKLLGVNNETLTRILKQQPTIIGNTVATIKQKMRLMEQLLGCEGPQQVAQCVSRSPGLLTLSRATLELKVRQIQQVGPDLFFFWRGGGGGQWGGGGG